MRAQPDLAGEQGYPYPAYPPWQAGEPVTSRGRHRDRDMPAPGIDLWANARLRLESMAAAAENHYRRYERLWQTLHQVPVTGPALSSATTPPVLVVDRPDLLGPHTGYYWDVKRLTFAPPDPSAPWAGTIYVYNSLVSPVHRIAAFKGPTATADDTTRFFAKAQVLLAPHERIVYAAGPDFTGEAIPGGDALIIESDLVPVYLK